ncbi:MAG: T9SS type A sorting domain-containing protein [Marinilabiliaceae bacterium]|nr:T9SS type A sorting domain-containing protein [Marinilabiliaceae bacterium]
MKKFYDVTSGHAPETSGRLRKVAGALGLVVLLGLSANVGAQNAQTWTGATNSSFTLDANWLEPGAITANNLTIPLKSAITSGNYPIISGADNISVNQFITTASADPADITPVDVSLASNDVTFTTTYSSSKAFFDGLTGLTVNSGTVVFNGYYRMASQNTNYLNINGGVVKFSKYLIMSNADEGSIGGKITISAGALYLNGGLHSRRYLIREGGQFEITGDGKMYVAGNFDCDALIASGYINGGTDYTILKSYDIASNVTTLSALPSDAFMIKNSNRQLLKSGVAGTSIEMVPTARVTTAKSLTWTYKKDDATTYVSTGATGTSYAPQFSEPGTYLVRCEGVDASDVAVNSSDVIVVVGSSRIDVTPYFPSQFIRVNQTLHEKTVTFTEVPTSFTWKYAAENGVDYVEFDVTPNGQSIYNPVFTSVGNYDVVAEATFSDGKTERSSIMTYYVEGISTMGKSLNWTGLYSADGLYSANYSPVAPTFKNKLLINASGNIPATFKGAVNDTISNLYVANDATMLIDFNDGVVFNIRGDNYNDGVISIVSGTVDFSQYLRLSANGDELRVSGDALVIVKGVNLGKDQAASDGGQIYVSDNARVNMLALPDRLSAVEGRSVTTIDGNARIYYPGDSRSTINGWIETGKIKCSVEGFEAVALYDKSIDSTYVYARNTAGFCFSDITRQFAGPSEPIATELQLANVGSYDVIKWYYSAVSPEGPWVEFDDATDVTTYAPAFEQSGTYYVIAKGFTGAAEEATNNVMVVEVVGVTVSPATQQVLPNGTPVTLTYKLNEGVTFTSGTWYDVTSDPNGVVVSTEASFVPPTTDLGTYNYVFSAEVADENSVTYIVTSAPVEVKVVEVITAVEDKASAQLSVYPNPSNGQFYVDGIEGEFSVEVIDMKGAVVYKNQFANGGAQEVAIDCKGIFTVKVVSGADVKTTRVVVK